MSRLDFRRSQHLSSLSPVSRWQCDHEGSRRNAIGKFRWGHGLCAGDGGRLGDELAGAQISAHRATAAVDTKARYHRRLRTLVANFRCSRSRPWSGGLVRTYLKIAKRSRSAINVRMIRLTNE